MRLGLFLLPAAALACAHPLRLENAGPREEPAGPEIISDAGNLILTLSATRDELVLIFEREVHIEQDVRVIQEADEVFVPWSGYAVTQFLFVSWNPVLWTFPRLWTEAEGRDHAAFGDWLRLWNPFVRAGGRYEEQRRRVVLREAIERRDAGTQRLPLNQMPVTFTVETGELHEALVRTTDNRGQIRLDFDILPPAMRTARPITVNASTPERGDVQAQLF
ncbi:MAG: hypothetical protein HUU25_10595 [Candidatus Sumerlaeia bacterium]|nr:hypothetical protein [Candidatus Sumerlaeia bacterium]